MVAGLCLLGWFGHSKSAHALGLKGPKKAAPKGEVGFDRLITAGIGVHGGYMQAGASLDINEDSRPVYGLHLHLRMFRFLGISAGWDFNEGHVIGGKINIPYPNFKLEGHLYLMNIGPIYVNIAFGLGFNFGEENGGQTLAAYLIGAEAGFRLHERVVINAGFRFLLPSYEQAINHFDAKEGKTYEPAVEGDPPGYYIDPIELLTGIFDFSNFQVMLSVRVFL